MKEALRFLMVENTEVRQLLEGYEKRAVDLLFYAPCEEVLAATFQERGSVLELYRKLEPLLSKSKAPHPVVRTRIHEILLCMDFSETDNRTHAIGLLQSANAQNANRRNHNSDHTTRFQKLRGSVHLELECLTKKAIQLQKGSVWMLLLKLLVTGLLMVWIVLMYTQPEFQAFFSREWLKYVYGVALLFMLFQIEGKYRWPIRMIAAMGVFMLFRTSSIQSAVRSIGELVVVMEALILLKKSFTEVIHCIRSANHKRKMRQVKERTQQLRPYVSQLCHVLRHKTPDNREGSLMPQIRDYCECLQEQYDTLIREIREYEKLRG